MGMYAKLMGRITESSLMEEPLDVRYCFMMLLAIADPQGYAVGTDVALARRMNMPLADFKRCVEELMKPDEDSNSKEEAGKRVILSDCERGYFVVNYAKYRDTRDEEHRREYMRDYMRKKRNGKDVAPVNNGKQRKPPLAKVEEEAKGDTPKPPDAEPLAPEKDAKPKTPEALAVAELFNRRPETEWDDKEIKAFKALVKRKVMTLAAMGAISHYYAAERPKAGEGRHRRDLKTFLNNFDGELDRAEAFAANGDRRAEKVPHAFREPFNPPPTPPPGFK